MSRKSNIFLFKPTYFDLRYFWAELRKICEKKTNCATHHITKILFGLNLTIIILGKSTTFQKMLEIATKLPESIFIKIGNPFLFHIPFLFLYLFYFNYLFLFIPSGPFWRNKPAHERMRIRIRNPDKIIWVCKLR